MDRKVRLDVYARIMIDMHGVNAAMVARRRITECGAEPEVVCIWREVLAIIESRQLECVSQP
jgi:hypothetical protein